MQSKRLWQVSKPPSTRPTLFLVSSITGLCRYWPTNLIYRRRRKKQTKYYCRPRQLSRPTGVMAGRRLIKKANVLNSNEPAQASRRVRHTSAVRPPNGPLNSHPVDETTRSLIESFARRPSRSNRQLAVVEVPRSEAPGRHDVLLQGPSYLIWNDPEAQMLSARGTGGQSRLRIPPRGGSAERQARPGRAPGDGGSKETRGGHTDRRPARSSNLLRHSNQKLVRSVSNLRSKYRAGETQNRALLPVSSHAPLPGLDSSQPPPAKSGDAGAGASAQDPGVDQPTQRRRSLRHRTSLRLRRTASNLGRRLSSGCGSSLGSDDEAPATGRKPPEETEALYVRELLARAVPDNRRRGPCLMNMW